MTGNKATRAWNERDLRHSWHPFTQMREYAAIPPVQIVSGQGAWVTDSEGRRYLDGNASIWTNVHGHNDPDLNAALRDQLDRVAHSTLLGLSHPVGADLAARLAEISPGRLNRSFFSDNGSNAVEIALKLSFQYWELTGHPEKRGVISMANGYHGDTFGTMAVGDNGVFHGRFRPWFFPVSHFPAPVCAELNGRVAEADARESLKGLEKLLQKEAERTACLIMEPSMQGAAGMRLQPPGFLREVAALCRQHGVHLILDEVFVAFGRLGSLLVCAEEGIEPDFLCLAKGLTAGYLPLAATVVRDDIYEAFLGPFESFRAFFHGHTFTGNPLAAAVSLASIQKLETMIASGDLARGVSVFGRLLEERLDGHPQVAEIRQRGMAAAVELTPERGAAESFPTGERFGLRVCLRAREHGLILRPLGDTLLLVPPLCVNEDEITFLIEKTTLSIEETIRARQPAAAFT